MKSRPAVLLLTLALLLTISRSTLSEMVFLSAERSISGTATQTQDMSVTNSGTGVFQDDLLNSGYVRDGGTIAGSVSATAFQTSVLLEDEIRGLGRGSGFATGLNGEARALGVSRMDVVFEVDEPMRFKLTGELRVTPHGLGLNGSSAFVRLSGPEGLVFEVKMDEANPPTATGVVDFKAAETLTGEFGPGQYTLEALAEGIGSFGRDRCADFDFTLSVVEASAVPEPSSVALLLLGSISVQGLRRRSRNRIDANSRSRTRVSEKSPLSAEYTNGHVR